MNTKILKKVVFELVLEPEVKDILDEHGDRLSDHDNRIKDLEIGKAKTDQILTNIQENQKEFKADIKRLENITLNHQNTMLNSMNQLLFNKEENQTKKEINRNNNATSIILKVTVGILAILGSLFTGGKLMN